MIKMEYLNNKKLFLFILTEITAKCHFSDKLK